MAESKTVVECEDGHNYTSRVVTDDDEDEREDVASVWSSFYFYLQFIKYVISTIFTYEFKMISIYLYFNQ